MHIYYLIMHYKYFSPTKINMALVKVGICMAVQKVDMASEVGEHYSSYYGRRIF